MFWLTGAVFHEIETNTDSEIELIYSVAGIGETSVFIILGI